MRTCSKALPGRHRQGGVNLIEVMVGLVIGLVASLVVMRSFSASEAFRRNVNGSADATQMTALVGVRLNMLIEDAGAGLVQGRHVWGCRVLATRNGAALLPVAGLPEPFLRFPGTVRVLPVGILDGGEAAADILMVISAGSSSGNRDIPFDSNGQVLTVSNPNGVGLLKPAERVDDLFLAVPQEVAGAPSDCQIVQAAPGAGGGAPIMDATLGLRVMPSMAQSASAATYTTIPLNMASTSYGALALSGGASSVFHLGREAAPVFSLISVNAHAELVEHDLLQRRNLQSFGENIVLLKARYGLDNGNGGSANDNVIDQWVSPGEAGWTLAELMNGEEATEQKIDQIKAIRIGMVVRSAQVPDADARVPRITLFDDLPGTGRVVRELAADQQRHRYQAFDWVIPLRNMKSIPKS